jgi:hypothetical protein
MSPPAQMSGRSDPSASGYPLSAGENSELDVSDIERILEFEPSAMRSLVAVLTEPVTSVGQLTDEAVSPLAFRAMVASLAERQRAEREGFFAALEAYKELTERLELDLTEARQCLAIETERARLERQQLVKDFLDRIDVLAAKISTSAARFTSELAEKDVLLQHEEQKVLAYAQQAATARSVIQDMLSSNSWRFTRPIRLMSRLLKQRPPSEPRR